MSDEQGEQLLAILQSISESLRILVEMAARANDEEL